MRSLIKSREASFGKTNRKCARKPLPANRTNLPRLSSNPTWSSAWIYYPAQLVCFLVGRLPRQSEELFLVIGAPRSIFDK